MYSTSLLDAVYNLCNGIDVEATRVKMECYRRDHQSQIMRNREKRVRDDMTAANHTILFAETEGETGSRGGEGGAAVAGV